MWASKWESLQESQLSRAPSTASLSWLDRLSFLLGLSFFPLHSRWVQASMFTRQQWCWGQQLQVVSSPAEPPGAALFSEPYRRQHLALHPGDKYLLHIWIMNILYTFLRLYIFSLRFYIEPTRGAEAQLGVCVCVWNYSEGTIPICWHGWHLRMQNSFK